MSDCKIGLLYSGQGSQVPELGKDFYENFSSVKALYDQYPQIRRLAFDGSEEEIAKTENTQPILSLFQIAVTDLLAECIPFHAAMGISLGEYGALYAAKVFDSETLMSIIRTRADSMAKDASLLPLSSAAVLNSNFDWLVEHSGADSYYISNINSPSQYVITGENLSLWSEKLLAEGYKKVIPLAVSGGFHSPYMSHTEHILRDLFEQISFAAPTIPIYFNYGSDDMDIKERMAKQVSHTINVHQSLEKITAECDVLIEIGANQILQKMVKKIDRSKEVFALQSVADFEKVRQTIGK